MSTGPIGELAFLRKLQRLLTEGDFSATYKFALLNALADLSLEGVTDPDRSLRIPLDAIAEKFIDYYWRQARPYRATSVLKQNAGRQAAVMGAIDRVRQHGHTLAAARRSRGWSQCVSRVRSTVWTMPLWKLQVTGGEVDEFLYRRDQYANGSIRLLPGVRDAFRSLHPLVIDLVRGAWMRQINQIAANRVLLGDGDLASFLFGSERGSLSRFGAVLREHQQARCLYCGHEIRNAGVVDHFIAWARYPADLGHNLVLTHARCNTSKRDFLAHPDHVGNWRRSHLERSPELAQRFDTHDLMHDEARTIEVARWAYEQGEQAAAHVWIRNDELARLDAAWRPALSDL